MFPKYPPKSYPVVKMKKAEGFNQQLNIDTFEMDLKHQAKKVKFLNICCEGTSLQMVVPLWKGATAKNVRKAYRKYWLRWAGSPKRILTDGGLEFDGEFQEGWDKDDSFLSKTAPESPWENGICEHYAGLWKETFEKTAEDCQPKK